MGELVSLRKAMKRKRQEEAGRRAGENRIRHGRTKAEKTAAAREDDRRARALDGHKLGDGDV